MEQNKSMEVMRRKFTNDRKEIFQLEDENSNITIDRDKLIKTVEKFYPI